MLTRLGEAGADTFTIKRIAGHSSITVSERYVHRTPEGLERAFERLETFNSEALSNADERNGSGGSTLTSQEPFNGETWRERQVVSTVSTTAN